MKAGFWKTGAILTALCVSSFQAGATGIAAQPTGDSDAAAKPPAAPGAPAPGGAAPRAGAPAPGSPAATGAPVPGGATVAPADAKKSPNAEWPQEAPAVFKVKFETSKGDIVAEFHKDWAPIGVQHFYDLMRIDYYNEVRFFRVINGFVAQFGISGDPAMNKKWGERTITDDPVKMGNKEGYIVFAKTGRPNSRSTQLFINLVDNSAGLDPQGFAAVAKIVEGMENVKKIQAAEVQNQGRIQEEGNKYLNAAFPNLDYVKTATLVKVDDAAKPAAGAAPTGAAPAAAAPAAPRGGAAPAGGSAAPAAPRGGAAPAGGGAAPAPRAGAGAPAGGAPAGGAPAAPRGGAPAPGGAATPAAQ